MRLSKRAKRRFVVVVAIAVIGTVGVRGLWSLRSNQAARLADENRAEGMAAYSAGEYEAALDPLSYYVGRHKNDVAALLAFAETRTKIVQPDGQHLVHAAGLYSRVLQIEPANIEALTNLLDLYGIMGRRTELIDAADALLQADPDNIEALTARAAGSLLERNYRGAERDALTLVALEGDNLEWRRLLLTIQLSRERSEGEILEECDRWADGFEGDGRAHLLKAYALAQFGRFNEATETAVTAVQRGAESAEVLRSMLALLDSLEMRDSAEMLLDDAKASFNGQNWIWEQSIRRLWQLRRHESAGMELTEAARHVEEFDASLLRWKALIEIENGDLELARATLDALHEEIAMEDATHESARAWAEALSGSLASARGHWPEGQRKLATAVGLDSRDPVLHFLLGRAYARAGEFELAVPSYERAFMRDRMWMAAGVALAESLIRVGRTPEALSVSQDLVARAPHNVPAPWITFAQAWLAAARAGGDPAVATDLSGIAIGRVIDALENLRSIPELGRRSELVTLLLEAYLLDGDTEAVRRVVDEIINASPPPVASLLAAARISALAGLGHEEQLLGRAAEADGMTVEIAELEGRRLHKAGRTAEAATLMEDAWRDAAANGAEADAVRRDLMRASFLCSIGDEDAAATLRDLLADHQNSTAVPAFVLARPIAWQHEDLILAAINGLKRSVGEGLSTRVRLAEARHLLIFHPDDDKHRADALTLVQAVLRETPDSLGALTIMADAMLRGDHADPDEAIEFLRRAVDLYPGRIDLYPRLIGLLQQQGDFEGAEVYLGRLARRSDLDSSLQQAELQLLLNQGDLFTAITRLEQDDSRGASRDDRVLLAMMYMKAGRHESAEKILDDLLPSAAATDPVVQLAADVYAQTGRFDEGRALLESRDWSATPSLRNIALGAYHRRHGRLEIAIDLLRSELEADPENVSAWSELASTLIAARDLAAAREAATRGLAVDSDHAGLRTSLGLASLGGGPQARAEALAMLRDGGGDRALIAAIELYDRVLQAGADARPHRQHLVRARDLVRDYPKFLPGWRLAVDLHARADQPDVAIALAQEAMSRLPSRSAPAEWAAKLLAGEGRTSEALRTARTWRARSLEQPLPADLTIAALHLELDRPQEAHDVLAPHADQIMIGLDRHPDRAALWLRCLVLSGRHEQAAEFASLVLDDDTNLIWLQTFLQIARDADAEIASRTLTLVEPWAAESGQGILVLAGDWRGLAARAGNDAWFQHADDLAVQASYDAELRAAASLLRGSIAEGRGLAVEAEAHYRKVLELQPADAIALNNLAFLLCTAKRYEEAGAFSGRAVSLFPDVPEFLDTHAQIMNGLGRLRDAESLARRAMGLRDDDPSFLVTLAEVFLSQSRPDDAAKMLLEARRLAEGPRRTDRGVLERIRTVERRMAESVSSVTD